MPRNRSKCRAITQIPCYADQIARVDPSANWWTLGGVNEATLDLLDCYSLREDRVVSITIDAECLAVVLREEGAIKHRGIVIDIGHSLTKS